MQSHTLSAARTLRGVTQKQLEAQSGVEQTTISKIERGVTRRPSADVIRRLERALRVRLVWEA